MKNESYWEEIEDQPPFKQTANEHNYTECWAALEKFQKDANSKLNAVCLIGLASLLRHVYSAGHAAGAAAAEYDDTK